MNNLQQLNSSIQSLIQSKNQIILEQTKEQRERTLEENSELKPFYEIDDYTNLCISKNSSDVDKVLFAKRLNTLDTTLYNMEKVYNGYSSNSIYNRTEKLLSEWKEKGLNEKAIEKNIFNYITDSTYDFFVKPQITAKENMPKQGFRFNIKFPYTGGILYAIVLLVLSFFICVFTHQSSIQYFFVIAGITEFFGFMLFGLVNYGTRDDINDAINEFISKLLNFIFFFKKDKEYNNAQNQHKKIKEEFLTALPNTLFYFIINLPEKTESVRTLIHSVQKEYSLPWFNEEIDFCFEKLTHKNPDMRASSLNEATEMYRYKTDKEYKAARAARQAEEERRIEAEKAREAAKYNALYDAILSIPKSINKTNEEKNKKIEQLNEELKSLNRKLGD